MRVKVVTAWQEDIGAGLIRIPKIVRDTIGVSLGDSVIAKSHAGQVTLVAVIADRSEIGKQVAGIDAATRRALNVELGSYITVLNPQTTRRRSRKPARRTQTTLLFNYGSNNPEQLEERLGHPVSGLRAAYLPGYRLKFLGYSYNRDGGVAGVIKQHGAEVCGYVAPVTEHDLNVMDRHEGVGSGYYKRKILKVMVEDDGEFTEKRATVYVPGPRRLNAPEHHYPSEEYLEAVEKTVFGFWDESECRDYLDAALEEVRRRNPEPPLEDTLLQDDLYEWLDATKEELGIQIFDVTILRNGDLLLNQIIVPAETRKRGVGTQAIEWLCQLADHHGVRIWLTPMKKNTLHGTTSMRRLIDFYKRFGFVLNRGRNKDFRLQEMMYRLPTN